MAHMLFDDNGRQFLDGDRAAVVFEKNGQQFGVITPLKFLVDYTGIRIGLPQDMCIYPILDFVQNVIERRPGFENIVIRKITKV